MSRHIASVCWGDHLIFGEGDGRLADRRALERRMRAWQSELGAGVVHWRATRDRIPGRFQHGRGQRHFFRSSKAVVSYDDFVVVPELARRMGMESYLYVSLFDEGWPLMPRAEREVSYHNRMHCQHVSWQSAFSRRHPEYAVADRQGRLRQWGVLCLGYRQVRRHFVARFTRMVRGTGFDGVFVCLRSQSRPAEFADQFGFNPPVRRDFRRRHGKDICRGDFDLEAWRALAGGYLTDFFRELKTALDADGRRLAVGAPRGDILGPPMGNTRLQWRRWAAEGLLDHLVIDQNSSRCPSMWHDLWPMHRGYGYLQNYINGIKMPALEEDIAANYAPVFRQSTTRLYLARQWHRRRPALERRLAAAEGVHGLVFSTFRHDNPGPVRRNDWRA